MMEDLMDGNIMPEEELELVIRERAYFLWEQAGKPEGRSQAFWDLALDQYLRARAYAESCQNGGL